MRPVSWFPRGVKPRQVPVAHYGTAVIARKNEPREACQAPSARLPSYFLETARGEPSRDSRRLVQLSPAPTGEG